jgi:hypothetical protein
MMRFVRDVLWRFAILLMIALPLRAQCAKCKLSDRGDRLEGIASRQVSGGCCALLGVQYSPAGGATGTPSSLHLHFWLPQPTTPLIKVWEPETNYLMMPKKKEYDRGLQRFSWPRAEVIDPLGLKVDALYVRVSDAANVHFPALLSTSENPRLSEPYLFILQSGGRLNVTCTVERQMEGRLVPIRTFQHREPFGGVFQIEWDGKDDNRNPAPEGVYVLRLKGTVETERIQRLNYTLTFQHHGRN